MVVDSISLYLGIICVATAMMMDWTFLIVQLLVATFVMCLNHHLMTMRGYLCQSGVHYLLNYCVLPKYQKPQRDIPKPVTMMIHSRKLFYLQQQNFDATLAQSRHFWTVRWNMRYCVLHGKRPVSIFSLTCQLTPSIAKLVSFNPM